MLRSYRVIGSAGFFVLSGDHICIVSGGTVLGNHELEKCQIFQGGRGGHSKVRKSFSKNFIGRVNNYDLKTKIPDSLQG
jgi:hypothetical protein